MEKKIVVILGPQASGTKLTASLLKNVFNFEGSVTGGVWPSASSEKIMIRYSTPAAWGSHWEGDPFNVVENKKLKNVIAEGVHNSGWVNLENLYRKIKHEYGDSNINIVSIIRDYSSTCQSLVRQGMEKHYAEKIHEASLNYVNNLIYTCRRAVDMKFTWLSYEFLTYDTKNCINSLSNNLGVDVSVDEETLKRYCDKIKPRNKYHLEGNSDYKAANHRLSERDIHS
tara:strand:+ start:373 stop:1053 length:681 start_codon:yes stop_codon:yes gene_type:complete